MMTRLSLLVSLGILAGLCMPAVTSAQPYPSAVVDFEDPDYGDTDHKEMFWEPEWSGSTRGIVVNETANDENNWAYRSTAFGSAPGGGRSLQVGWKWEDPADEEAWVRFTTYNAPERPNPSLDTRGKVLFKIKNISEAFLGNMRVCIGIRESGLDVPQLFNGGTSGAVEWVGVKNHLSVIEAGSNGVIDTTPVGADYLIDTNGVQYIVGGGADHALSTTPDGDDVANYGYFANSEGKRVPIPVLDIPPAPAWRDVEFDLAAMTVTYNGTSQPMWITNFALGNGILDPDNDRGVLDAINFVNDVSDGAVDIAFGLDDVQFIATVEDPTTPPTVEGPIYVDETSVKVTGVYDGIDRVVLMMNGTTNGLPVTIDTNGITEVDFPIAAAVEGQVFTAKQRFGANQKWSLVSEPVTVETVPFPGPFIRPPVDGATTVSVGGLDPAATELEVFINTNGGGAWVSLGTAAPGDVENFDFTLPAAAIMGQELHATQTISGGTSDAGYPVIVTTNGLTEHFYDDFEGYADQAAYDAAWVAYTTYTPLTLVDNMSATAGAATRKSAYSSGSSERNQRFISETPVGTDTHPLVWSFHFFDEKVGNPNQYADLRRTVPAEPGGSWSKILEIGNCSWITNSSTFYQARILNGPNWFTLDLDDESTDDRPAERFEGWHTMTAVIKSTTIDYYVDGILSEYGRPNGGEYQFNHLVLGSGLSSSGGAAWYDDVRLTTGAVEFPAIAVQPPKPPTVVAPIIPLSTTITVTDINTNADLVTLYWDQGAPDTIDPAGMDTVEFTVAGGANAGDVYWATQTVAGLESPDSESVTVLLPAPVIHHAPADNTGAASEVTVTWLDPAANLVTIVLNTNGAELTAVPDPGAFTVDVPVPAGWLKTGDKVAAKMRIGVVESVWSDEETITVGTETVRFYDTMEAYADQDDYENDSGEVRDTGWWPSSGDPGLTLVDDMNTTISGSQAVYCPTGMSPPAAGWSDGYQSNFDFLYPEPDWPYLVTTETEPLVWSVSVYDAGGAGANQGRQWVELRDYSSKLGGLIAMGMPGTSFFSTIDLDYYSARVLWGVGYVNLDDPGAPTRTIGWHKLTAVVKPTSVDFYVDGILAKKGVSKSNIPYDNLYMGSGYDAGAVGYYDDFKVHNGAFSIPEIEVQAPLPPTVVGPVEAGNLFVTVEGVVGDATDIDIYANGTTAVGHLDITTNGTAFEVPVTALVHLDSITATQSNAVGESGQSNALEVGKGNGVISLGLGIRETGDVVALGSPGGTAGDIELVNVTTNALGIRSGVEITPQNAWQTIEFDPANGVDGFTGDGVIDGTRGTFEHLALFVSDSAGRSAGVFEMYVDNVINVDADGLGDFLITDFEGYDVYEEVLFAAPHVSGSTAGYLSVPPSRAGIRNIVPPVDGTNSVLISWNWKNTDPGAWVRDTTSSADFVNRPVIDITKPVRMDVLLPVSCLVEPGDLDEDGTVDINDFQYFPACLSGPGVLMATDCECADLDGDLDVDLADFGVYQNLLE